MPAALLRDAICPQDFGALADGVHDDTAALCAASALEGASL